MFNGPEHISSFLKSTFGRSYSATKDMGFKDDINTYLMMSSAFTTFVYMGSFVGPTVMGILIDNFGFRMACVFFFPLSLVTLCMDCVELIKKAS